MKIKNEVLKCKKEEKKRELQFKNEIEAQRCGYVYTSFKC